MERTKQEEIDYIVRGIETNLLSSQYNLCMDVSYILTQSHLLLLEYKKLLYEKEGKLRKRREEMIYICQETIEKCKGI